MTHECAVCNTEFESTSSRAKYCPDCRKLSKKEREELVAEVAAPVSPAPEYKAPDAVPPPALVATPPVKEEEPEQRASGRRVCKSCGGEYTVKHGKGGCPLCALDRHFNFRRI